MNYNILTYIIYLPIIIFITIKVGWMFYTHGEVFLYSLFQKNARLVKSINNMLLIGYYLVNIGYAIITIAYWESINSIVEMINALGTHLGVIVLGLALLHYNNIVILNYLVKSKTLKL